MRYVVVISGVDSPTRVLGPFEDREQAVIRVHTERHLEAIDGDAGEVGFGPGGRVVAILAGGELVIEAIPMEEV